MNDANDKIKELVQGYSDVTIKEIITEYQLLQETGLLPQGTSLYRELTKKICGLYGIAYNLRMGESWLVQEVFRRFNDKIDHSEKLEYLKEDNKIFKEFEAILIPTTTKPVKRHVYFLSDEEINKGDWWLNTVNNDINQAHAVDCWKEYCKERKYAKKIIATTNPVMTESPFITKIPTINLLQNFIDQYDSKSKTNIQKILVEVTEMSAHEVGLFSKRQYKLKINPKDNTINIK